MMGVVSLSSFALSTLTSVISRNLVLILLLPFVHESHCRYIHTYLHTTVVLEVSSWITVFVGPPNDSAISEALKSEPYTCMREFLLSVYYSCLYLLMDCLCIRFKEKGRGRKGKAFHRLTM